MNIPALADGALRNRAKDLEGHAQAEMKKLQPAEKELIQRKYFEWEPKLQKASDKNKLLLEIVDACKRKDLDDPLYSPV
jgi:hypothetical protein